MNEKEVNAIRMNMLKQAQLAMKEAVEQQNAAMISAIAALVSTLGI
ncbi:hypothetical protein ACO1PF_00600 [Alkalibacterium sp. f15]